MRQFVSRGMVQIGGITYRIERLQPHHYAVVRLVDDVAMGTFLTLPSLRLSPQGCEVGLFAQVARAALRFARTSGVMAAVSVPSRVEPSAADGAPGRIPARPWPERDAPTAARFVLNR